MEYISLLLIALSSLWLLSVAWLMWLRPDDCLRWLNLFASTWRINLLELGSRAIAGLALLVRAPWSKLPTAFEVGGWFILISSLLLLAVPRRWHSAYAKWWAARMSPRFVRAMAPLTAIAGIGLFYLAL
jgi:hypothetical protein